MNESVSKSSDFLQRTNRDTSIVQIRQLPGLPVVAVGGAACTMAGSGQRAAAGGGWSTAAGSADSSRQRSAAVAAAAVAAADHTGNWSEETQENIS